MDINKLISSKIETAKASPSESQEKQWNDFWKRNTLNKILDVSRAYESNYYVGEILKPYFNKDSFCELGCGTGIILKSLTKRYKQLIAVDYAEESLNIAKTVLDEAKIKNYKLVKQDIRDVKNIKPLYDVVFSNGLVEHFVEPSVAIESHLAYAKSGGTVVILVPYRFGFKNLWFKLTDNKLLKKYWPWTEQRFFDEQSLEKEVNKIDQKLISEKKIRVLHKVENVMLVIKRR